MQFRAFCQARRGNQPEECEDAFAALVPRGRFALADGASGGVFPRSWAQWLVAHYVALPDAEIDSWTDWLPRIQREWMAQFHGQTLPWFVEVKLQQGAFATLLGLHVTGVPGLMWQWHAVVVGDTCVLHTRGDTLLTAFPIDRSDRFNNTPVLLGSRTPAEELLRRMASFHGSGVPNDRLWLMTDALTQWCLAENESGRNPWAEMEFRLLSDESHEDFTSWIEELRDTRGLRNDDVTLMAISF